MNDRTAPGGRGTRPVRPSASTRPPARVFWIRRLVVLGLPLLVVVALVVWWAGRGGDAAADDGAVAVEPTSTPTPTVGVPDCAPDQLELTVGAAAESFASGVEPTFEITVTNGGDAPCLVDAGDGQQEVVITSGEDRVWSSRDCAPPDAAPRTLLLAGGQSDVTPLTWPRERSAEGCADGLPEPGEGTYSASVSMGGATSPAIVFGLG